MARKAAIAIFDNGANNKQLNLVGDERIYGGDASTVIQHKTYDGGDSTAVHTTTLDGGES